MIQRTSSQTEKNHERKEVNFMKYEKPEVVTLVAACNAVQGTKKGTASPQDSAYPFEHQTSGAYEADE